MSWLKRLTQAAGKAKKLKKRSAYKKIREKKNSLPDPKTAATLLPAGFGKFFRIFVKMILQYFFIFNNTLERPIA